MISDLVDTDCIDVLRCDHVPMQCIAEQFFQFALDILHIGSDFSQKISDRSIRYLFSLPPDIAKDPTLQCRFILKRKFHNMTFCFHRLIQLAALVHFFFHKNKISSLRHGLDILCQICTRTFKQSGIFKYDQPAFCKKR